MKIDKSLNSLLHVEKFCDIYTMTGYVTLPGKMVAENTTLYRFFYSKTVTEELTSDIADVVTLYGDSYSGGKQDRTLHDIYRLHADKIAEEYSLRKHPTLDK